MFPSSGVLDGCGFGLARDGDNMITLSVLRVVLVVIVINSLSFAIIVLASFVKLAKPSTIAKTIWPIRWRFLAQTRSAHITRIAKNAKNVHNQGLHHLDRLPFTQILPSIPVLTQYRSSFFDQLYMGCHAVSDLCSGSIYGQI